MKIITTKISQQKKENYMQNLMQLLGDPIRSRIYFEALINDEITAQQLMKQLNIHRSTLTHHLTKFVEAGIFSVRIQDIGRPIKYYRINKLEEKIILKKEREDFHIENSKRKIEMLESIAAHLQVISNLTKEIVNDYNKNMLSINKNEQTKPKKSEGISFTFNLLTEEQTELWFKKFNEKMYELNEELIEIKRKTKKGKPTQIVFSGSIPIIREL